MLISESIPMVTSPGDIVGPPPGAWTYDEYLALPDDGRRYEILAGVLNVAPSPNADHQLAVINLVLTVAAYVKTHQLGMTFAAPFDVRLGHDMVLQPDLFVVLTGHVSRVGTNFLDGAPDLIVEVASPGTATYDRHKKLEAYERAGVPEYWIVDPAAKTVELFILEDGTYRLAGVFQGESVVPSTILPEFRSPVASFFG